ncbi:Anoctamin-5-like 2 [Homarus americanus]|uniref:Anoctamin n=1 Tax=Homarus americanus TaxID=6706 RepID=A0A8J5MT68_HOMAM|nr:Anoctamin-5-like 2 [Homarus americanus]
MNQRIVVHFPGLPALEFTPPAVFQDMTDCVSRLFNFVRLDDDIFPPKNRHFTAVYSRDKDYLFEICEEFFTSAIRARIVDFILRRKRFKSNDTDDFAFGIEKLLNEGVYAAAYPIHEGDLRTEGNERSLLFSQWAAVRNFYKYQPLDYVKDYFGVKIGLYFAWLGFYTYMLIPASIVGLLCFFYAVATINNHPPSHDICSKNITMCPLCDHFCNYWSLQETCFHARFTYLVDNPATIFFTAFMSLWAALFLEMWKRYSAEITHRWDLTGFDIQEEHPRPQYLARLSHIKKKTVNIVTKTLEPRPPFWRMRVPGVMISLSSVFLLVTMALVAVMGVILYRMSILAALSIHGDSVITSYAIIFTSTTAAFINLICIMIFNQIYARVAEYLTELELQRTQTEFDDSLTLKIYLLQFINYYSSIFYIAFFKGKMVGYPGDYNRVLGSRQEECSPGGCLLELSVQLAIIMVGKQAMNTCMEMFIPLLWKWYNMLTVPEHQREAHNRWPRWAKDFRLVNFDPRGLFPEYLEMDPETSTAQGHVAIKYSTRTRGHQVQHKDTWPSSTAQGHVAIKYSTRTRGHQVQHKDTWPARTLLQYGFVTIFVSSFPLAPFFAFLNNVFEMRLDAKKLLTHFRRPIPQRVKDIGIWFKILDSIGKFAAFIIAFTSNFIPELVYRHVVSDNNSLEGFLNHSLAYFDEQIRREAYVTNELIVEQELRRARGDTENTSSSSPVRSPLRRMYSEPARSKNGHDVRFRINGDNEEFPTSV